MKHSAVLVSLACLAFAICAQEKGVFQTDPNSPELQSLARTLDVDESKYGCGPLLHPQKTYYVSVNGDDKADGLSWQTAWRHVSHGIARLKAGDTLVIGEGEYFEPHIEMNVTSEQSGEPGKPITIMAAPRHRVVIIGAEQPGLLQKTPDTHHTFETTFTRKDKKENGQTLWESDTLIELQPAGGVASVDELPATYCYDEKGAKLYVHFSDSRGPEAHGVAVCRGRGSVSNFRDSDPCGFDIRRSYIHVKGLQFKHYHTAMLLRGNKIPDKEGQPPAEPPRYQGGHHITVEDCTFCSADFAGLLLYSGAQWNLIKNNYGALNGERGSLLMNHKDVADNLFVGNWLAPSTPTVRTRGKGFHYGINNYGHGGPRNIILNNTMNDTHSFRSKYLSNGTVLQGNVMTGDLFLYLCTYFEDKRKPEERFIVRNNTILGPVTTAYHAMGPGGPGATWGGPYDAFVNNFAPDRENKSKEIEAARFADPAYVDYRLQSDSPLIGKALGGGDVGAFRTPKGRVLYVAPNGNDEAAGTSERLAFKTLRKAASGLRAGDTLYILPSTYAEPLEIRASGTPEQPIHVRAFGKGKVMLPGIVIAGSHVVVEGFTMGKIGGDAIAVRGSDITVMECGIYDCDGAGIRASASPDFTVSHCTLVNNVFGVVLEQGSRNAAVRDCVLASSREGAVDISEDSREGYLASNNCTFGGSLDKDRIALEPHTAIADPKFVNPTKQDYRLQWDSPAACLAAFARPAGAFSVAPKPLAITDITIANLRPDSAVVLWATPKDDTTGVVQYRIKGSENWSLSRDPEQGTIHGVGLSDLKPATDYEFQASVTGRRGGVATSEVHTFKTPTDAPAPACYHLSPDGSDKADGRSPETAWRTMRKACFEVGPGDTVLIAPGEYHHAIAPLSSGKAEARITFKRHGAGEVIIDGRNVVAPLVNLPSKSCVTIDGLIFAGTPYEGHPGVMLLIGCVGVEIVNCRVGHKKPEGGFGSCVLASSCKGLRFESNVIWGTRYHFVSSGSTGSTIRNNTFAFGQVYSCQFNGDHKGTKLSANILYSPTSVPNPAVAIFCDPKNLDIESDYNLFYLPDWGPGRPRGKIAAVYDRLLKPLVPGDTLQEWQKSSGLDRHSTEADPMFVDVRKGDFRLKPGSPAIGAGRDGANIGALGAAE